MCPSQMYNNKGIAQLKRKSMKSLRWKNIMSNMYSLIHVRVLVAGGSGCPKEIEYK